MLFLKKKIVTVLCEWMTFLNLHSFASEFELQGVDMFGKRVGFLKFKADIIDEETKTKVIDWIVAITVVYCCAFVWILETPHGRVYWIGGHLGLTTMV